MAYQNRRAVAFGHHDVENFVSRPQQADAADQELLLALLNIATARVGAAALQRREQLLQTDLVILQLGQIGIDFVLLDEAAKTDDVCDAG